MGFDLWRKNYRKTLIWIGIIGPIIFGFLDKILLKLFNVGVNPVGFGERLQIIVLTVTTVILFWYTKETFDLKQVQQKELKEVRKQTDHGMRPFLRLQYNPGRTDVFTLVNDGRGIAKDVIFEKISFGRDDAHHSFEISKRPVMSAGGNSSVSIDELRKDCLGLLCGDGDLGAQIGRRLKEHFKIQASYFDIEDNRYEAIFESDPSYNDGFRITKQNKIV